ncbi:ectomycorrhiza-regulated small secreted protein [Laccaria bicolor S238N-H82]|uniref:Ectomycorrhiza-regulated small secreted protein n=1 Tax=Laccaria bicolor (strain S238N-H82 / ATCC MYA-4686) TaxID=486041 RepID=B0D298_LACBS|nr:ectomycorrhiza-regulated small secreted protein [Laccaria bicolor S238N-H82]EDR10706.1 ectomycorrhiza-regulated small secreted protein [Laccaria bicolor S238N-H82]|eukprot:XP_001878007.1 ectomycorrhiza-regulated small secreted protein [Laccaria bicolor S238N-H82]
MTFKLITVLATLSFLPLPTLSLSYNAYSSTNTCSGSSFGCIDNGGACCGGMPTGYGYSTLFNNLPGGSQGQGYSSGPPCTNFIFNVFAKCWNSGGRSRAAYLNWFHSPERRRDEVGASDPPLEEQTAQDRLRTLSTLTTREPRGALCPMTPDTGPCDHNNFDESLDLDQELHRSTVQVQQQSVIDLTHLRGITPMKEGTDPQVQRGTTQPVKGCGREVGSGAVQ